MQGSLACIAADGAVANADAASIVQEQAAPSGDKASSNTPVVVAAASPAALPVVATPADDVTIATAAPATDKADAVVATVPGTSSGEENDEKDTILQSPLLLAAGQPGEGFVLSGGAQISPDQAPDRIDQLTKQILLKEIEMERFNLHYTQEVARQGRWKGIRYGAFQEVNAGMGLTGAIISTAYRGARLDDPKAVKPCIQESANYIPMIGSYIGAGAAALEFGINGYHDIEARRHGYGPAESIRRVGALKSDIDKLMAERDSLIKVEATSAALSGQTELDQVEGKVLEDLLDQSLQEFERFDVGARRLIAFQQTQFFFDMTKYITNSLGYQFAFLTLHDHHRRYNGNAGALFVTSGALTVFGPIVSRLVGKGVAEMTRSNIHATLGHSYKEQGLTLQADLANLDRLAKQVRISNNSERAVSREANYGEHERIYTDEIRAAEKAKGKAVLSATQNIGAAAYVGGTKIASGVCFLVVGFNHNFRAGSDSLTADRVTNTNLFAASVIAIPASAFSMLDTMRIQVQAEITRHKQKAKGELQGQLVAHRLAQLDELEKRLKTN